MLWKFIELSSFRKQNRAQKRTLSSLNSLCGVSLAQHPQITASLSQIFHSGLIAYHNEVRIFGPPCTELSRDRCMKNIENAMSRTIAQTGIYYEKYMTTLGSIVTAAPFLGLLGNRMGSDGSILVESQAAETQHCSILHQGSPEPLLTTVAALGVAIPSVVGYNYIVSFIKGDGCGTRKRFK